MATVSVDFRVRINIDLIQLLCVDAVYVVVHSRPYVSNCDTPAFLSKYFDRNI